MVLAKQEELLPIKLGIVKSYEVPVGVDRDIFEHVQQMPALQ